MPACESTSTEPKYRADVCTSDGATPQDQTKQILAVTPILRGQHGNEKNHIPPFTPKQQAPAESGDLIDFGQSDAPPAQIATAADIEQTLRSTSTQPGDSEGPLIDFQDDLKSGLPTVDQKLKRQDTETNSVDEFLDARS
jgi:hypothetical protein